MRSQNINTISVLVLCHKRTWHLDQVLQSLSSCKGVENSKVIFVAHEAPESVIEIINKYEFKDKSLLTVNDKSFANPAEAINHNLSLGLNYVFETLKSEVCLVLEDDIVLASDALQFVIESEDAFAMEKRFRGVMLYSSNAPLTCLSGDIVKINFGIGHGWSMNRKTYSNLRKFWKGSEKTHWDYFIEPYLRTGYIVAPIYSRVLNIGFDSTATHTFENSKLQKGIESSFYSLNSKSKSNIREVKFDYIHSRTDLINVSILSVQERMMLYFLRDIAFRMYLFAIRNKPRIHFAWRKLRDLTDEFFSNAHTNP
jgi:hypothetical protein